MKLREEHYKSLIWKDVVLHVGEGKNEMVWHKEELQQACDGEIGHVRKGKRKVYVRGLASLLNGDTDDTGGVISYTY